MGERPLTGKRETGKASRGVPVTRPSEDPVGDRAGAGAGPCGASRNPGKSSDSPVPKPSTVAVPVGQEIGGREGPDPVRYGDWEVGGRCVDF